MTPEVGALFGGGSAVKIGTSRGHLKFIAEEVEAAIAAHHRGDSFTVWRHLRAIQETARKAQGI